VPSPEARRNNEKFHAARKRTETAQARRDGAVRRAHDAGASVQGIAGVLGCNRQYVHQIVRDGLAPSERVVSFGYAPVTPGLIDPQ
jgi:hypothetical protein